MLQIQKRNQNWLPSVFDDLFFSDEIKARPSMNVLENGKEYLVQFTAPGFKKEEASVSLEDGQLVVSLQQKQTEEKGEKYLRREFTMRNYRQSFLLPDDVDAEKISASLDSGILSVVLPKYEQKPPQNAVKRIEIC